MKTKNKILRIIVLVNIAYIAFAPFFSARFNHGISLSSYFDNGIWVFLDLMNFILVFFIGERLLKFSYPKLLLSMYVFTLIVSTAFRFSGIPFWYGHTMLFNSIKVELVEYIEITESIIDAQSHELKVPAGYLDVIKSAYGKRYKDGTFSIRFVTSSAFPLTNRGYHYASSQDYSRNTERVKNFSPHSRMLEQNWYGYSQ